MDSDPTEDPEVVVRISKKVKIYSFKFISSVKFKHFEIDLEATSNQLLLQLKNKHY